MVKAASSEESEGVQDEEMYQGDSTEITAEPTVFHYAGCLLLVSQVEGFLEFLEAIQGVPEEHIPDALLKTSFRCLHLKPASQKDVEAHVLSSDIAWDLEDSIFSYGGAKICDFRPHAAKIDARRRVLFFRGYLRDGSGSVAIGALRLCPRNGQNAGVILIWSDLKTPEIQFNWNLLMLPT